MTRDHVQTAVKEGVPFAINMADGKEYKITDSSRIFLGKAHVVVIGSDGMPRVLPMLTMTGIRYLKARKATK